MTEQVTTKPMRILAAGSTWHGANDNSFVHAFRRAGHSVTVVSDETFVSPGWQSPVLKSVRRLAMPLLVNDYQKALIHAARGLRPEMFFVFKGTYVKPETLDAIRALGSTAVNFYPDVGFTEHGPYIPRAISKYDWIFTTKSFRLADMESEYGIVNASYLPHAYDPEMHAPVDLDDQDRARYACQAAFIGGWTPKKEEYLLEVRRQLPQLHLKVWGGQWERAKPELRPAIMNQLVWAREYAKAIQGADLCIAMLVERRPDSASGDLTTARTYEIPAVGGFMLHERTDEAQGCFSEGTECAMYGDADELIEKIRYFMAHPEERQQIAAAGHRRCLTSGYSVDDRAATIVQTVAELRS